MTTTIYLPVDPRVMSGN